MKAIFIPTQYTGKVDLEKIELDKLPESLGIITTAQFQKKTEEIIQFLESKGKKTFIDKVKQKNAGQLLGCDQGAALKIQDKVDAYLYVGSGDFHPMGVVMKTDKDVFLFNPVTSLFEKFDRNKIGNYEKIKKVKHIKFLSADNIGILVSVKLGQYSYNKAVEIKQKLEEKGKNAFIFVFDELNTMEMENFNFIEFWINTACPRIADDRDKKNVMDMADLENELIQIK
ncbi:diphthamide synthesis protein [Candidatus Woesearchaeota archaeon]|nr:diphthamide synthesis protein [Candidatus Woesearchaeota archaeon]